MDGDGHRDQHAHLGRSHLDQPGTGLPGGTDAAPGRHRRQPRGQPPPDGQRAERHLDWTLRLHRCRLAAEVGPCRVLSVLPHHGRHAGGPVPREARLAGGMPDQRKPGWRHRCRGRQWLDSDQLRAPAVPPDADGVRASRPHRGAGQPAAPAGRPRVGHATQREVVRARRARQGAHRPARDQPPPAGGPRIRPGPARSPGGAAAGGLAVPGDYLRACALRLDRGTLTGMARDAVVTDRDVCHGRRADRHDRSLLPRRASFSGRGPVSGRGAEPDRIARRHARRAPRALAGRRRAQGRQRPVPPAGRGAGGPDAQQRCGSGAGRVGAARSDRGRGRDHRRGARQHLAPQCVRDRADVPAVVRQRRRPSRRPARSDTRWTSRGTSRP